MLPQTTLDQALQRTAIAARRAELRASHRTERAVSRRETRRRGVASQTAVCCAA